MIVDITGAILTLVNFGKDCLGNGNYEDVACCCDKCDYMLCCLPEHDPAGCEVYGVWIVQEIKMKNKKKKLDKPEFIRYNDPCLWTISSAG